MLMDLRGFWPIRRLGRLRVLAPARITIAATERIGFSAHSFLAQAVDNLADAGDPYFMGAWAGGYDLHMMPYSSLAQRWDAHGVDRTGSYSGALWLTEFANPYGGWPATDSAEGIDTLQRLYWYALTAQAKGCRALFIYPPWSPASATDEVLDGQTMARAVFWQDWLGQHVQIPVYVMPVPVIVRRIRAYLSPGSPFKAGDDLHLSNSDNGAPRTSTMAALGAGLIMMMTGTRLPDDPGWSAQMRDLVGIVWDAIAEYACTGLGGTTVVAPASGGDPLPAPLGLPA